MSDRPEPINYFEKRVRDKAQKENISEDEARRLIEQEVKDRLSGKFSTNPKSDDNVEHDAFGEKPKVAAPNAIHKEIIIIMNHHHALING